jgi:hypothetical protein
VSRAGTSLTGEPAGSLTRRVAACSSRSRSLAAGAGEAAVAGGTVDRERLRRRTFRNRDAGGRAGLTRGSGGASSGSGSSSESGGGSGRAGGGTTRSATGGPAGSPRRR